MTLYLYLLWFIHIVWLIQTVSLLWGGEEGGGIFLYSRKNNNHKMKLHKTASDFVEEARKTHCGQRDPS